MNPVKKLHRDAMECVDLALEAKGSNDPIGAQINFKAAYLLERSAAEYENDPFTKAILLESAATLALDCDLKEEHEELSARSLEALKGIVSNLRSMEKFAQRCKEADRFFEVSPDLTQESS